MAQINLHRQQQALDPATAEGPIDMPVLSRCELRRLMIADQPGGQVAEHEFVTSLTSGLTFRFVRKLKQGAIYGEVWSAIVVEIHGSSEGGSGVDSFYTEVLDESGCARRLAVKRMPWDTIIEQTSDPHMRENPLREIVILTEISNPGHPHVLGVEEALDDGSTVYLTTPFVGGKEGGDMFDWVHENHDTPASEAVIRPLLRQILEGLHYVHSKGVCHADMSLENTLLNATHDEAFIIDFGMALKMPTDDAGRRLKSVPDGRGAKKTYRAPEMNKGKVYDGVKVDVFSVGCMAFMMFTGICPFDEATRLDWKFKKVVYRGEMQDYLRKYGLPSLPEPVHRLLRRMMAYRPEDRPLPADLLEDAWFTPVSEDAQQQQQAAAPVDVAPAAAAAAAESDTQA